MYTPLSQYVYFKEVIIIHFAIIIVIDRSFNLIKILFYETHNIWAKGVNDFFFFGGKE